MQPPSPPSAADSRERLDELKLARLRGLLAEILPRNSFYAAKLGPTAPAVESLAALEDWPFTLKEELVAAAAPTGVPGNLTWPPDRYVRFHRTSGTRGRPLPVFDTAADWDWWMACWSAILARGGVGPGDRVFVASSFGPYVGFWSGFEGAIARGAMAIPSGGMSTRARLELLRETRATVLVATPSYALHLAEVAAAEKIPLRGIGVRLVIVAGEPGGSLAAVRGRIEESWDAAVLDHAGASEVGPWGVGIPGGSGLHVVEPWFHAEFLPCTAAGPENVEPLAELVLTTLGRAGAPVIRYRTGDLVRPRWPSPEEVAAGRCPWVWLDGGIVGRVDDMIVVRGVNVFPAAIDGIIRSFPEIVEYRLTVGTHESLDTLSLEVEDRLADPRRVAAELQVRLGLRVDVVPVPIGSLPRHEGKARRFVDRRDRGPSPPETVS